MRLNYPTPLRHTQTQRKLHKRHTAFTMGNSSSSEGKSDGKSDGKSRWQRYEERKRGPPLSEEEIMKYTGKSRDEINKWAETTPGVGKNQLAGKAAVGNASGLGGVAMADGFGGWGFEAELNDGKRGMKFPPNQPPPAKAEEKK